MKRIDLAILFLVMLWGTPKVWGQENNLRQISWSESDSILLDSLLIYPNSIRIKCDSNFLNSADFNYNYGSGKLSIFQKCNAEYLIEYRVLQIPRTLVYQKRDTSMIYNQNKGDREKFLFQNIPANPDVFGGSGLNKSGSISRGITFGNNQNLGINSSLNLELSGDIAPNLKLLAVLTDDNLPIQPDGNTNQLREFDQVFVQLYNDQFKLIAGDFWLRKPKGYFLTYQKRAQGLTFENAIIIDSTRRWNTQFSGALSRGKFNRQIIQGVEGNQGPYRLTGAENEPFIIVLSGTEQVFIDGRLLDRGQEFDYTVNYNTAEVTFTSRNLITKDSRIVIEFQYSDQNYARSILQTSISYEGPKLDFWLNGYSEQDAKNQSLQQDLSFDQKRYLSTIGDSLQLARASSIDSIGFVDNQVLYALRDSLGYDSVLVYTVNQDSALYRAVFINVGQGNGDYVFSNFNALGRVYRWVAPIAGVSQGDFIAARLLATPKKTQLINTGVRYRISKRWTIENEAAVSINDINTFSRLDQKDDQGYANKFGLEYKREFGDSLRPWKLINKGTFEYLDVNFKPIQQFRAVEFDRDWNVRNAGYTGEQFYSVLSAEVSRSQFGNIQVEGQRYNIGSAFEGYRAGTSGNINSKGFAALWTGSYLQALEPTNNSFNRHKANISQGFGPIRLGYQDDFEENRYQGSGFKLARNSYRFYDYQAYAQNNDSSNFLLKAFYRERYDWISDSTILRPTAKATTIGGEWSARNLENQRLTLLANYRTLKILDTVLVNLTPENSLLGRVDYEIRAWKSALTFSNFYEAGSGLELRKEFLYIKVNDGQGIYTWIDYNGDGIKDLNEFEVAQFVDQASYIRVFTPSNVYVKTFSNELNQSVAWRPERLWANKVGFLKALSLVSTQTRFRTTKKTSGVNGFEALDPRLTNVRDTQLISTSTNFRNTVYFNRISSIFSAEYSFQNNQSKTLLASGFDGRAQEYHEVKPQLNVFRKLLLACTYQQGSKQVSADYTAGRNYNLRYQFVEPSVAFQPNTTFRWTVGGKYTEKFNDPKLGGEFAYLGELNTDIKLNQAEKGSLLAGFKTIQIKSNGNANSALGFELLEGLKTGLNFTWNAGYQRSLSKNLQLSIQYAGRKSENNKTIHSGGMEVRAFF
ncbi:MAG: hypothetical protein KJ941_13050 [Bacteroidetes bacterium]|nr:hypothetical protein [Bacteroidota bacterium]